MKELILKEERYPYEMHRWDDGRYSIKVLCGGVLQFEAEILLNEQEKEQFPTEGARFSDDLAYCVSRDHPE